jgi:hypothetical protein
MISGRMLFFAVLCVKTLRFSAVKSYFTAEAAKNRKEKPNANVKIVE